MEWKELGGICLHLISADPIVQNPYIFEAARGPPNQKTTPYRGLRVGCAWAALIKDLIVLGCAERCRILGTEKSRRNICSIII